MKNNDLERLLRYAGRYKALTYLSWVLSAISAILALLPFICIWLIIRDVLASEYGMIARYGAYAVALAIISMLVYIAALMCSHIAAFRVAANMRKEMLSHVISLPLGVEDRFGSGKMRKIINDSSAATETYLAHQLPDRACSDCYSDRTCRHATVVRLETRTSFPSSCRSWLPDHDADDWREDAGEDEAVSGCAC